MNDLAKKNNAKKSACSLRPINIDFHAAWDRIRNTLESVITLSPVTKREWHDRFSDVYSICISSTDGLDAKLYKETKRFFENHTTNLYKKIMDAENNLIVAYHHHWQQYKTGTTYINSLYRYLNEHYAFRKTSDFVEHIQMPVYENNTKKIGELAFEIWKNEIINKLKGLLINALLAEIDGDRNGKKPSQTVVKSVIFSFIDVHDYDTKNPLKLYQAEFEALLLEETSNFYQNEANKLFEHFNCSKYMEKVESHLFEEGLRVRRFFDKSTYDKVINVAQSKLVQDHLEMMTGEFQQMVKDFKNTDLKRMYDLLKPLPDGFLKMLSKFEDHVTETGLDRVKSLNIENDTGQFVNILLELHKEYTLLVEKTFNKDQAFFGARDKACTKVVNHRFNTKRACRSPELLAKYCDSLLKKSTKTLPDIEIEECLNNVITIFKYLDDKDVFQKFYSKLLAKRLIHNLSVSMDTEEGMITKLKLACGYEYTNKLHRMFTDMAISKDLDSKFSDFLQCSNCHLGINFSLLVLQSGAWPLGQIAPSTVALPPECMKSAEMFKTYYNSRFNGRKLTWLQNLSNGEVKITYLNKPYLVTCTTYQMSVMLLFNEYNSLTYSEISKHCQLEEKELKRTLQSIVDVKLFQSTPQQSEDLCACAFSLNETFSNKRTKFKITSAVQRETAHEVEQTHTAVDEDRKMYTQASIVRIMKSRKIMKHNNLMQEVINQSRSKFSPSTQMIKKCIEALIEKTYIERVTGSRDEYSYVA